MNAKFIEIRENAPEITRAYEKAKKTLAEEHNICINYAGAIPTIAHAFLKSACEELGKMKREGEDTRLDLFNIITLGVNFYDAEEDEKLNNYEPVVIAGDEFKQLYNELDDNDDGGEDDE